MKLLKEDKENVMIYRVQEERLDTQVAPELKTEFLKDMNSGKKLIILDLSEIKHIDSSGLGALLFGLRQFRETGGDMKLIRATSRVLKLIEIGHLEKHLLNYENEADAINSFE